MTVLHIQEIFEKILANIPVNNFNAHLVGVNWNLNINANAVRKTIKLQKWYHGFMLESEPDNSYTRKTLIRYYLIKYEREWLLELPKRIISKCQVQIQDIDNEFLQVLKDDENAFKKVRYFMHKYTTLPILYWYGW